MSQLHSIAPFEVVTPFDPAIDHEACNVATYTETRDMNELKFYVGKKPTTFHVQRLPQSKALAVMQHATNEEARFAMAFRFGLVRVDNLAVQDGVLPQWRPEWCKPASEVAHQALTEKEMELFALDEIIDIGSVIMARANLRPGRPVCFVPPHSSALGLALKIRSCQRAAAIDLPSNLRSEPNTPQTTQSSETGGVPGDVTGTANQS